MTLLHSYHFVATGCIYKMLNIYIILKIFKIFKTLKIFKILKIFKTIYNFFFKLMDLRETPRPAKLGNWGH